MIEFAIIDEADQQFGTIINNKRVTIRLRYNVTADRWTFDLSIDDAPVLHGRRIVTGADLVAPFDFGIGAIFAYAISDRDAPGRAELPAGRVRLFQASADEIAEALA